jgi:Co/Zn/Cd efflux system component
MSAGCSHARPEDARLRRVLWIVFGLNIMMFGVELTWGWLAGSVALHADAIDFFADSAAYLVTLVVLQRSLRWRAGAALAKGALMAVFGCLVLAEAAHGAVAGGVPDAPSMGAVGLAALVVNVGAAVLLFAHRGRDVNLRSVWLCSRNDALNNVAVVAAALGVFGTAARWPDLGVAVLIAALNFWSAAVIIRHALKEFAVNTPASSPAE